VPSIPTILSVRFILNPEWGMVNQLIFKFTGNGGPIWLNDPTVALAMAIRVHIWKSLPFWTLICASRRTFLVLSAGATFASSMLSSVSMNDLDKATMHRMRAIMCNHRASQATDLQVKRDWEELATMASSRE